MPAVRAPLLTAMGVYFAGPSWALEWVAVDSTDVVF